MFYSVKVNHNDKYLVKCKIYFNVGFLVARITLGFKLSMSHYCISQLGHLTRRQGNVVHEHTNMVLSLSDWPSLLYRCSQITQNKTLLTNVLQFMTVLFGFVSVLM